MLKTVLEDAKGSRLEGISFGDVKADLHYTESKDTVCLLYYPEINEFQGRKNTKKDLRGENVMTANRKVTARYAEIARFLGLHFNEEFCVAYGEKDGFTLRVSGLDTGRGIEYGMVCISVGVAENGVKFEPDKQFRKEHKGIMGVVQEKHTVRMTLKRYVRVEKIKGILQESLPAFLDMLRMEGFTNGCELCGEMKETGAAYVAGNAICLCDECYDKATQNAAAYTANEKNKKENLVGGVVGALIGSLLGAASIILLSQLGYVAAISGVIMAVCALKGYELLGGKLTKKGVIISVVIMIVMTYVGDRVDWAIMIARELETDVFYGYRLLPLLLSEEVIDMTSYVLELVLLYALLLVGAIPTIQNAMRKDKVAGTICKL